MESFTITKANVKSSVLEEVKENGMMLQNVSESLCDDREVVYTAVTNNGMALQWASYRLRGDRGIVAAAVRENKASVIFELIR